MKLQYYIIHCLEHSERLDHINNFKNIFGKEIIIFPGINTTKVSLEDQEQYISNYNKNIIFKENFRFCRAGEIGCYLSHFNIIENIMINQQNKESEYDYSIIFEDDVWFDSTNIHEEIDKIIDNLNNENIDFDIIFLGLTFCTNIGIHIKDNIYLCNHDEYLWGTHSLLINNKNIKKIYDLNFIIHGAIDNHYKNLSINNKLKILVINPQLFSQKILRSNIQ
jgi:GR25 family glycosyltransferase involved in LPS biosynthesis